MIEKNPLESYEQELESQKQILDSLNKHSEELKIEKSKMNKYEYEERYSQEEEKINQYIDKTNLEISRLEKMIDAYHNIEKLNEKLKQLETIIPRDSQEQEELNIDKRKIEELKNKNMDNLPEEIKELFFNKNLASIAQEEKISNEVFVEDNKEKGIDDYRKEMEENEKEIKHLKENIEKLISLKESIPSQEYERDLETLKRYKNRENGKLLRNRQIVTAYELVENNQERINYLNSLIARDEQDKRDIKEELDFLTNENEKNKRFLPKTFYQSLTDTKKLERNKLDLAERIQKTNEEIIGPKQIFESRTTKEAINQEELLENKGTTNFTIVDHKQETPLIENEYFDEEATPEEIESYANKVKERIRNEKGEIINPKQIFKTRTTQESLNQEEPRIDFSKSKDLFKRIKDLSTKSQNNPSLISLTDTLKGASAQEESKTSQERVASQDNSSQQKFYGINLVDLNKSKEEVVEEKDIRPFYRTNTSDSNSSKKYGPEDVLSTFFENSENQTPSESKENENNNIDDEEKGTSSKQGDQNENLGSDKNKEFQSPIPFENQSKDPKKTSTKIPKRTYVTRTRKPKKNIKELVIIGISTIATTLVLLSVGINKSSSKKSKQAPISSTLESTEPLGNTETELGNDIIEIFDAPNQTYSKIDSTEANEFLETQFNNETETLEEQNIKTEKQTEVGMQKVAGHQVETKQEIPQAISGEYTFQDNLIEIDDLINPQVDTNFFKTIEVTDSDALENAFMNSGIIERKAEDEYSASQENWEGVKDENIQYWIDNPLRFTEDEKTGAYLMEQQDENGNWVGMGWTDAETAYQYLQNLESYENQTGKGRH